MYVEGFYDQDQCRWHACLIILYANDIHGDKKTTQKKKGGSWIENCVFTSVATALEAAWEAFYDVVFAHRWIRI